MIDMYRMQTDPHFSSFRWEKQLSRIMKLQKHFPFKKTNSKLPEIKANDKNVDFLLNSVYEFAKDNESIIMIGEYAYDYLINESGIKKDKIIGEKFKRSGTPFYEMVSLNYRIDGEKLLKFIKKNHNDIFHDITITEYYPFWNLLGYSFVLKYKKNTIAYVINYKRHCVPIKTVKPLIFRDNQVINDENGKKINIGSFAYTLLNSMIFSLKGKVDNNKERMNYCNIMTSHLIEARNYHFKKENKTMFDETLFQEYIPDCVGETMDPMRENRLVKDQKYKEGKRGDSLFFRYKPEEGKRDEISNYKFANSSGNPIKNLKNIRINNIEGMDTKQRSLNGGKKKLIN